MSAGRIATRYSKALYRLAGDDLATAKKHMESLKVVQELFDNEEGGKILRSPVMPSDLKGNLLAYAMDQGAADENLRQ